MLSVLWSHWHLSHPRLYEHTVREKNVRGEELTVYTVISLLPYCTPSIVEAHSLFPVFYISPFKCKKGYSPFFLVCIEKLNINSKIFALALKASKFSLTRIKKICHSFSYIWGFVFCWHLSKSVSKLWRVKKVSVSHSATYPEIKSGCPWAFSLCPPMCYTPGNKFTHGVYIGA